ncbi:MAG TPA: TonB family protein [Candidatus Limnocylindria bacterium]|nr:TonB family protein [Candidatus Limnocylindria bacterium]
MASPMQRLQHPDPSPLIRSFARLGASPHVSNLDFVIHWPSPWQEFRTSLRAYFTGPRAPRDSDPDLDSALRIYWVRGKLSGRAFMASSISHIAATLLFLLPIWGFIPHSQPNLAPVHIELTWYPPAQDLPPIELPGPTAKPSPSDDPAKPLPQRGADAYHPRQTILSTPVHITHPRQTLIQPDAPQAPPKIVPQLPNIVEWAATVPRPKLHIAPTAAAPRVNHRAASDLAAPEVVNSEKNPGALNIASAPVVNQQPQMPVTPMSAPVARARAAQTDAAAAPEVGDVASSGDASLHRIIALSATPGPLAPEVAVPQGNLSARIAISPDGKQPGVPGSAENGPRGNGGSGGNSSSMGGTNGAGGAANGTGGGGGNGSSLPAAISISGGSNPHPSSGGAAPAGTHGTTKLNLNPKTPLGASPAIRPSSRRGPASVANFDPSLPPEKLLSGKEIFTLHVNMPNLSSATGSWVLNCAQLDEGDDPRFQRGGKLSGPDLLQKVDPKYPPEMIKEHVQGEVILYAIIRKDGSVDSIQLVRGIDPQLDRNAMEALAHWKFRPGTREGAPIDMETVAHIPFRFRVSPDY